MAASTISAHPVVSPGGTGDGIDPLRITVSDEALRDLHERLDRTRWPDELPSAGWAYGVPLAYLKDLTNHWRDQYEWRRQEARLNALPHFHTTIDGAHVHFVHLRSARDDALPLILSHGWPGSIVEFLRVLGPLTDPAAHGGDPADAFHVVVPSLPGFGLSGPTVQQGWDVPRIASAWATLMNRLGYARYGVQGGDWGARISWELGVIAAPDVVGVHVNMLVPADPPEGIELTAEEQDRVAKRRRFQAELSGYMRLQATRPQTIAYALTDSPVGQLAWIIEKFKEWTDSPSVPEDAIPRDDLLTNVMLYWLTGTAGSAARIYFEHARSGDYGPPAPSATPTGVAVFAADVTQPIRRFAQAGNNIIHWSEFARGGHFAAMERPEEFVSDVRAFFRRVR